jgi:hypothetical protein
VHVSSCSLVLVSRYERVATVGNFYTEDVYAVISGEINLTYTKTATHDNKQHMVDHIHLNIFTTLPFKDYYEGFIYSSLIVIVHIFN